MIKKIISGGQTGTERAALDVAIQLDIPHGGWIVKGRETEDGRLPDKYRLKEMPTDSYPAQTANNILFSDGTLIIFHGIHARESSLVHKLAAYYGRPYLHVDLNQRSITDVAGMINSWVRMQRIGVLNITGPSRSKDSRIYQDTVFLLQRVLKLLVRRGMRTGFRPERTIPTIDEDLIDEIISQLPLKERVSIANMEKEDITDIHHFFDTHIRGKIESEPGEGDYRNIMKRLWERLRETYRLRVVK